MFIVPGHTPYCPHKPVFPAVVSGDSTTWIDLCEEVEGVMWGSK